MNYNKDVMFVVTEGNPINGMSHVDLLLILFIFKEAFVIVGLTVVFLQTTFKRFVACFPSYSCCDSRGSWTSKLSRWYYSKLKTASFFIDFTIGSLYLLFIMAKNMSTLYRMVQYVSMLLSGQVNNSTHTMYEKMSNIANIAWNATLFVMLSRLRDWQAVGTGTQNETAFDGSVLADTPFDFW